MHGPYLSPRETAAALRGMIDRRIGYGVDEDTAIIMVAADNCLDVEKVRWILKRWDPQMSGLEVIA